MNKQKNADHRNRVDFAKELLLQGKKFVMISAKLAVKFGGNAQDYNQVVRQANIEVKRAKEARRAILEHVEKGGEFSRSPHRLAKLVLYGPAHPECPVVALKIEAKKILSEWEQGAKSIFGSEWRKRVSFAKDVVEDDPENAFALYRVSFPSDNPLLCRKVMAVAKRELANNANDFRQPIREVASATKASNGKGRQKKKKIKKARKKRDKQRASTILKFNRQ